MKHIDKVKRAAKVVKEECKNHPECFGCPLYNWNGYPFCWLKTPRDIEVDKLFDWGGTNENHN